MKNNDQLEKWKRLETSSHPAVHLYDWSTLNPGVDVSTFPLFEHFSSSIGTGQVYHTIHVYGSERVRRVCWQLEGVIFEIQDYWVEISERQVT